MPCVQPAFCDRNPTEAKAFFSWDFGLPKLPDDPGIIVIRDPRQYGLYNVHNVALYNVVNVVAIGCGTVAYVLAADRREKNKKLRDVHRIFLELV